METNTKRRRIMIISGDDHIIDQIQKLNDISSCKAIILDTANEDIHITRSSTTVQQIVLQSSMKKHASLSYCLEGNELFPQTERWFVNMCGLWSYREWI